MFYDGFETRAYDHPGGRLRSEMRRGARTAWRTLRRKQVHTGFYTAFRNLCRGLAAQGVEVRVNDYAHARAHPSEPVGISGFPSVYDRVRVPNPAVFGPGYVPSPPDIDAVRATLDIRIFTLPSDWPCRLYPSLGDAVQPLFAPVDVDDWPDLSRAEKTHDFVVYDKIHWRREARQADLVQPLLAALAARGLRVRHLRYGDHHFAQYREALRRSRALLFLCEHETQGLAYQEAMAANIPVLAWDEGVLRDPRQGGFAPPGLRVSSVPYFDARCGLTFRTVDLEAKLDAFLDRIDAYAPRAYVAETLNPAAAASRYLELLERAAAG